MSRDPMKAVIYRRKIAMKSEQIKDIYATLKEQTLPLYLYGAGNLAEAIFQKLREQDIAIAGCVTDSGTENFHGCQVGTFASLMSCGQECNLLLGFASAYARKHKLEETGVFKNVFEIANPFNHHKQFGEVFLKDHMAELKNAYDLLEDEYSKKCFSAFIRARIENSADPVREVFTGQIDEFNNDVMHTKPSGEIFLDVGAYQGGSIERFLRSNGGHYEKIIGIEPENRNFDKLRQFCRHKELENVELHHIGCWYKKDKLYFNSESDKCCRLDNEGTTFIDVDTIDNICGNSRISILNLGISTAEKEILLGAKETIQRDHPRMLVFMGSAREELYELPIQIKALNPAYQLYLRFIQAMPSRFFLYAIPSA